MELTILYKQYRAAKLAADQAAKKRTNSRKPSRKQWKKPG